MAKIRLSDEECTEVIKRWCENLCSVQVNKKELAVLLLLSCRQYWKALEILSETTAYVELSFLLMRFAVEKELFSLEAQDLPRELKECTVGELLDRVRQNEAYVTNDTVRRICERYLKFKSGLNCEI